MNEISECSVLQVLFAGTPEGDDVPAVPVVALWLSLLPSRPFPGLSQQPAGKWESTCNYPCHRNWQDRFYCGHSMELTPGKPWLLIISIAWVHRFFVWVFLLDMAFVLNSMASACAVKMALVFLLLCCHRMGDLKRSCRAEDKQRGV